MASDKRLDQVKLVNSAESVLVVNGDQVEKATLAGFANSMGSSVPLQQTTEQVNITGLYARTSDGKMVELTKESVASVVAGILRVKTLINHGSIGNDANDLTTTGDYLVSNVTANIPIGKWGTIKVSGNGLDLSQMFISINGGETFIRSKANGTEFCSWQRIDNFGYNSLAELSSGVAEQINNLKSILYTFYISGSYGLSDPINIAREVVSNINSNNEIRAFFGIYNCEGVRLVYGYLYNGSLYGSIFIAQFSAEVIRVDIINGEYTTA